MSDHPGDVLDTAALTPEQDAARMEQEAVGWMTMVDMARTMRSRDRAWTIPRVAAALMLAAERGLLEVAVTGRGQVTVPVRFRRAAKRPGEILPRETPEAMRAVGAAIDQTLTEA